LDFACGQRWHSLTEPELGLGLVETVEGRQVVIAFPARDVVRRYATGDPPLARARLSEGQQACSRDGISFRIEETIEVDALLVYRGEGREISESDLDAELDVLTPENRMRSGQVDDFRLFDLRHDALVIRHRMLASPARGFIGGRIRLFDHQLSIARDVCERHRIRVLLADEVGLGKTIEALLILHRLLLTGRVENALILVPPALVHQWLAEAYLRFNLVLSVMGDDTHGGGTIDVKSEDLPKQLLDAQLFVCPLGIDVGESFSKISWDILIVDEAHHLQPGNAEFALVARLAAQTEHVIMLSATPDRDGEEAHFRRLALLDPARFHDIDAYYRESQYYRELATVAEHLQRDQPLDARDHALLSKRLADDDLDELLAADDLRARRLLLARLLDLHGLGRVMFRNVRARISGFPRRIHQSVELDDVDLEGWRREFLSDIGRDEAFRFSVSKKDPRLAWLTEFLKAHAGEKVLVLCSNTAKVQALTEALTTSRRKVARFHEDMGSIERDRQAAWFLDDDGPQVVISSAIGAEGRNFQVARHLVLLDLPLSADRLEQAIGRVDRIGQGEEVHIYPVVAPGTPQARLRRWHSEALRVFERPWHGSQAIEREFGTELIEALLAPDEIVIEQLISRGKARNEEIVEELESGRDRLLELTSFDTDAANQLRQIIAAVEHGDELEAFMVDAFERGGLDVEVIGLRSYAVRAGMDYHLPFPGFVGDEMGVTFDRATALAHPERVLLTWDHPMVRDTVDTLLAHEAGNASVARLIGQSPGLLLEALYVAETTLAEHLRADRFIPPTPIRVVVDMSGEETQETDLRHRLEAMDSSVLQLPQVGSLLPELLEKARDLAVDRGAEIAAAARERVRGALEPSVQRLVELARVNPAVGAEEIAVARAELAALIEGLDGVRVRLVGLRLVLVSAD
jgi:ATP-dependent helicase HepA